MFSTDPDIRRLMALRAVESGLLRLQWLAAATRFELTMRRHERALKYAYKAGFNPDEPRDDHGRWTDEGLSSSDQSSQDRLEQSLRTAPDQTLRVDLGDLQDIANDPAIRSQIDAAWNASNPFGESPQENGFWISRNAETGQLFTRPFENAGSNKNIEPGPPPSDAVAFFHTHPNRSDTQLFQPGPSLGDIRFADDVGLPGLLQSHNGMYYFGPPLKTPMSR